MALQMLGMTGQVALVEALRLGGRQPVLQFLPLLPLAGVASIHSICSLLTPCGRGT